MDLAILVNNNNRSLAVDIRSLAVDIGNSSLAVDIGVNRETQSI